MNINIHLLKGLLKLETNIEELENFKKDFTSLDKKYIVSREYLLNTSKISPFAKNKKSIIELVNKYNNLIIALEENKILTDFIMGFDLNYHWEDIYKKILLNTTNPQKAIEIIEILEKNDYKNIYFVEDNEFSKIFYEKIGKRYNKEEFDIEYYFSNGKKIYLAQYYNDYYPILFKNANIILIYKEGNLFSNKNIVYLNSFNFNINDIKFPKDTKEIVESINKEEINKFNLMCENLRNIEKEHDSLTRSITTLEKLVNIKELKNIHKEDLNNKKEKLKEINELKKETIEKYIALGYDKYIIERSIDYLKDAEWNSSLHID